MIHILGFNLYSMYNYGFKTKNEAKNLLFHSKKITLLAYLLKNSIYLIKKNIPLSFNYTIHYHMQLKNTYKKYRYLNYLLMDYLSDILFMKEYILLID
jgi:hypothetical protein